MTVLKLKHFFIAIIASTLYKIFLHPIFFYERGTIYSNVILTTTGPVRGILLSDDYIGVQYYSFQGIPYAESPTGSLRFKPPVPKKPWTDILNATKEGPVCFQPETVYPTAMMSEDCLTLNINVPVKPSGPLPVFVFIHGGAYLIYSGNSDFVFGPQFFMQNNVIFVSLNFRLGVFGFLSLDIDEATGNAGLKDIILALTWIKKNIEQFNGDKNKITIGGDSSGSCLVQCLLMTEKSKGLFQQTLLISGNILGYKMFTRHQKKHALDLANALSLGHDDIYVVLERLRQANATEIIKAQSSITKNDRKKMIRHPNRFIPSTEILTEHAVITEPPIDILRKGKLMDLSSIIVNHRNEGIPVKSVYYTEAEYVLLKYLDDDKELLIPTDIEYPFKSPESQILAKRIHEFYFNGRKIDNKSIKNLMNLVGDIVYTYPTIKWMKLYQKYNRQKNPWYYMIFAFDGDLNWFKKFTRVDSKLYPGAGHSDLRGYMFVTNITKHKLKNIDNRTYNTLKNVLLLLNNFFKYGNPTPDHDQKLIWPKFDINKEKYLVIGDELRVRENLSNDLERTLQFWDNVYQEYENYLKNGGEIEPKTDL